MGDAHNGEPFTLLIKPASADCNLACAYCFYLSKSGLYPGSSRHRMSEPTLRRLISSYLATDQPSYSFGWQGGEPTLMGSEFFRKVVQFQSRYGRDGARVGNGLQTNATLITEPLARLFAEYRFLLGVSLDGPESVHDSFRTTRGGSGSYARVMKGIKVLREVGVQFNVLVTVNAENVGKAAELYRFLVDQGILYHQYIPIVEFDSRGRPLPFSINAQQWGEFLIGLYEQWYPDAGQVSVRHFDAVLAQLLDGTSIICTMGRDCRTYFLVEHNGDVYPCDFFVEPELRLGNIMDTGWEQLRASPRYERFGRQKSQYNARCESCPYLDLCAGDCLKNRFHGGGRDPRRLSWLCEGWKAFYDHTLPGFQRIVRRIRRQRSRELTSRLAAAGSDGLQGGTRSAGPAGR